MNRLSALVGILSVVGCASAPAPTHAERPPSAAPVTSAPAASLYARIPAEIGAFKLTERTSMPGAPGDSAFRFRDSSRTRLTVFVYAVDEDDMTEGDPRTWTAREGERFKEVQEIQVRRGRIAACVQAFSDTTRFPVGGLRLLEHFAAMAVRYPSGAIAVDMQFIYVIGGKYVKVRATIPREGWQESPVATFARELARRLAGDSTISR